MTDAFPAQLESWDVVVAGGGAAGFFAAIACAERGASRVLIVEKSRQPLGKVLISGGGRCNVTHACYDVGQLVEHYPRGKAALRGAFTRFQPADTVTWFEQRGVPLKTEPDGRVFPVSDQSQSVVSCLLETAHRAGVSLWAQTHIQSVEVLADSVGLQPRFLVHLSGTDNPVERVAARCLLLATGSDRKGMQLAAGLGHSIEPPVPSLFTFKVGDARLEGLAGVSVPSTSLRLVALEGGQGTREKLPRLAQQGALLVTHWGLSGPAVLRLSAWGARWLHAVNYHAGLLVNWLGELSADETMLVIQQYHVNPAYRRKKVVSQSVFPHIPLRLWKRLAEAAGVTADENWGDLSRAIQVRLAKELTAGSFIIQGRGPFKEEFVTCGGVRLDEVDFKTMQSKQVPGLYFAGEVLDTDGLTGGFNLQNAWTTGWIAGCAIAERLKSLMP